MVRARKGVTLHTVSPRPAVAGHFRCIDAVQPDPSAAATKSVTIHYLGRPAREALQVRRCHVYRVFCRALGNCGFPLIRQAAFYELVARPSPRGARLRGRGSCGSPNRHIRVGRTVAQRQPEQGTCGEAPHHNQKVHRRGRTCDASGHRTLLSKRKHCVSINQQPAACKPVAVPGPIRSLRPRAAHQPCRCPWPPKPLCRAP